MLKSADGELARAAKNVGVFEEVAFPRIIAGEAVKSLRFPKSDHPGVSGNHAAAYFIRNR